ncbi:hypothetical protein [Streptomyces sp. ST2-7A]|uniref:hypothetical protein n=1 Tax=Streptomyces sp. ST2-7A TaxID=2907214 RepID=UPI001F339A9F|nr:hypothetical protein [Streptomyces sp. ST2-7A]MCE7082435.1 hypothetical protein [Streptomyces sp. ST2-7A]
MRTPRVHPILATALAAGTAGALLLGTTGPASAVTAPDIPLSPGLSAERAGVGTYPAAFAAVVPALAEEDGVTDAESRVLPVPDIADALERLTSLTNSIMELVAALPDTSETETIGSVEPGDATEPGAEVEPVLEDSVDELLTDLLTEIDDFVAALLSGLLPNFPIDGIGGIDDTEGIDGGGLDEDFPIEPIVPSEGAGAGDEGQAGDLNSLGNLIDLLETTVDGTADPMMNPAAAGADRTAKIAPFLRPALPVAEIREP